MSFRDLTAHDNPSVDMKTLLNLGPKSYIQLRGVKISNNIRMIDRFERHIRMKYYWMSNSFDEDFETPRSYRKNKK